MTIAPPVSRNPADGGHSYDPIVENRASSASAGPLRVVAFNAQGGARFDGILRCLSTEPLKSASIILLSESDLGTRRAGGRVVASEFAKALGMSCAIVPEFGLIDTDGVIRSYLGNAILSREPLEQVRAIALPKLTMGYRRLHRSLGRLRRYGGPAALVATINLRGAPLEVCVAHLDSRADPMGRDSQIAAVLEGVTPKGRTIFGGDLNTTTVQLMTREDFQMVFREMIVNPKRFRNPRPYEPLFGRLSEAGFEVRGANAEGRPSFTFTRLIPPWMRPRLDWIALRELQPIPGSAAVIPARPSFFSARVSDHDFIAVDVAV
jgi:endonuclease/exonuclease/phosphatase family metal-dependent hydrolase